MGKSIRPMGREKPGAGPTARSRRSSVRMSLQLAIPWRVALQQSPPLLHQPGLSLKHLSPNDNQNPVNCETVNLKSVSLQGVTPSLSRGPARPPPPIPLIPCEIFFQPSLPIIPPI